MKKNLLHIIFNIAFGLLLSPFLTSAQNINRTNKKGPIGLEVNTLTGNLFIPRTDFLVSSRMFNIETRFFYNSFNYTEDIGFGNGWSFLYHIKYKVDSTTKAIIWGDGREEVYTLEGGNVYKAPQGFFNVFAEYATGKFSLTEKDGTKFLFENGTHKRVTKVEEPNGNFLSFQYSDTFLVAIATQSGQTISLAYDNGRLASITDAISIPNRIFNYAYDGSGNLLTVTDPLNGVNKYSYLVNGPMKKAEDKNNNAVDIIYYNDFVISELIGCNKRISFSYDSTTASTYVTDHLSSGENQVTKYEYKKYNDIYYLSAISGNCCGFNMKFEFDAVGNKIKETDANNHATAYSYDDRGNVLTVTDALNQTERYTYSNDFNRITSYTDKKGFITTLAYDSKGNLTQMVEPGNLIYTATYNSAGDIITSTDPKGNVFTYTYDANGNPLTVTGPEGYAATLAYDARGRLLSYTDARNNQYSFEFDILDRLKKLTDPMTHTQQFGYDAEGNEISYKNENNESTLTGYDASNRPVKLTDALGNKSYISYDGLNNIRSFTDPLGNTDNFSYDSRNRLTNHTDALGNHTTMSYDGSGNLTGLTMPNSQMLNYSYDELNRITLVNDNSGKLMDFIYDKNNNVISYTNGTGTTINAEYDSLNRVKKITDALGNFSTYTYDKNNNLTSITDRNGQTRTYTYDGVNRTKTATDRNGFTVTATYDAKGNLTQIKDQNNNITLYHYEALNRVDKITYPDGKFTEFTYDLKGNIVAKKLTDGTTITFQYDSLNRIRQKTLPSGDVFFYSYDAAGRIVSATNNSGTVYLTYDALNRIASETFDGRTVRYNYNTTGRTQTVIYPDSSIISKNYDTRNRLISITKNSTLLITYEYNNANQITKKTFGNGIVTNYQYDFANRLSGYSTNEMSIQNSLFSYDKEKKKTAVNRLNSPSLSEEFSYDNGNRLTSYRRGTIGGTPTIQNTYSYDAVGNRTAANLNSVSKTYTSNSLNQLTNITGGENTTFTYDNNGNRTFDGVFYKKYDAEGRLLRDSSSSSSVIDYTYDAFGRRVVKTINGHPFKYTYSRFSQVEERDGISNSLINRTVFNSFLSPVLNEKNNLSFYYHQNELNSVEVITNAAGNVVERYRYDVYGKPSLFDAAGNPITSTITGNRFGFTGQEYDSATGNYRFFFRNYSPATGTFDQRDLIGYADGMGMYQYVHNNPANGVDVLGLDDCDERKASELYQEIAGGLSHGGNHLAYISEFLKRLNGIDLNNNPKFKKFNIGLQITNLATKADLLNRNWNNMSEENRNIEIAELELGVIGLANDIGGDKLPGAHGKAISGFISALGAIDAFSQEYTGKSLARHYAELDDNAEALGRNAVKKNDELFQYHEKYLDAVKKLYGEDQENWTQEARDIWEIHERVKKFRRENTIQSKPKPDCPQNDPGGTQKPRPQGPGVTKTTEVISSNDPNEIIGPDGYGTNKFVSVKDRLPYTITYENDKSATAPAKFVKITTSIQPKMDASTFRLGSFGFNSLSFNIPDGTSSYYQRLDARDSLGLYVDVTAGYDQLNNQAFWEFQSIDPVTLLPPSDPLKGFLLLQDSAKQTSGHGFVNFSIKPVTNANTGDTISTTASIIFDQNPVIPTNRHKNTIDAFAPTSSIDSLPAATPNTEINLLFSGSDDAGGSGVRSFSVYVSDNNGPVQLYIANFTGPDTTFRGLAKHTYRFYVAATDNVSNIEEVKLAGTVRITDGEEIICPNGSATFESNVTGTSYQWQVNNGSGFTNLSNGGVYSGVTTAALSLTTTPTSFYGYEYRCIVNGTDTSDVFIVKFEMTWTGNLSSAWENPANWSCNSLPDANTDVIISGGRERYPEVNSNPSIRSLRTNSGASVNVNSGRTLTIIK